MGIIYYNIRSSLRNVSFNEFFNSKGTLVSLPYTTNSIENIANSSPIKKGVSITFENVGEFYTSYAFRNSSNYDFEILILKHSSKELKKWVISDDVNWPYNLNFNLGAFLPHRTDDFANLFMFPTNQLVVGQSSFQRSKLTFKTTGQFELQSPYMTTVQDGDVGQDFSQVYGIVHKDGNLQITERFGYITVINGETNDPSTANVYSNNTVRYLWNYGYLDDSNNFWYWDQATDKLSKIDLSTFTSTNFTLSTTHAEATSIDGVSVVGYGDTLILPIGGTNKADAIDISNPESPSLIETRLFSDIFEPGFTNDTYYTMTCHALGGDVDELVSVGDEVRILERHFPVVSQTSTWDTLTSSPVAKRSAQSFVYDGKIYLVGGKPNLNTLEYNPDTDTWNDLGVNAPDDFFLGKSCFHNNKFYGMGRDDSNLYVYEPPGVAGNATGTWTTISKVTAPPTSAGIGFLVPYGGYLWRWGGDADNSLWKFDLTTETWTDTANPSAFSGVYSNSVLVDDVVYIFNELSSNIAATFNLNTETWSTSTALQSSPGNYWLGAEALYKDDYIILGGGGTGAGTNLYVYSIDLDEHKKIDGLVNLPVASQKGNLIIIGSTLYFFQGQADSGVAATRFYKLELKF